MTLGNVSGTSSWIVLGKSEVSNLTTEGMFSATKLICVGMPSPYTLISFGNSRSETRLI